MSICVKCQSFADHEDEKTICGSCVIELLKQVSLADLMDIQAKALQQLNLNEMRWKAKGAGYR